jgi:RNA polymerase sigma factor (sigma-70 family)
VSRSTSTGNEGKQWDATRASLLIRLRDWQDQESWRDFFNTYWKLIYAVAIRAGLSDHEAEEVVQETVLSIAKKMDSFKYDPAVCSFKGWLLHVARLRIQDQFRKRGPHQFRSASPSGNHRGSTDTVSRVPDPASLALDGIWDEEWHKNLIDAALERIKGQIKPEHYQIFYLSAVKGMPSARIAKMLAVNIGRVYLVRHRVGAVFKKEIAALKEAEQ